MEKIHAVQPDLRPVLMELIDLGMSQSEIAREIGLSRATVNFAVKKESGKRWMPGYDIGVRLIKLRDERRSEPKEASHA